MILERIWLALQRPETWVAIMSGAGVLGVPIGLFVAWWRRADSEDVAHYRGFRAGFDAAVHEFDDEDWLDEDGE